MSNEHEELAHEQDYVSMLYGQLDRMREEASAALGGVRGASGGTRQYLVERDIVARETGSRLARIDAAEDGLCFGRLDLGSAERLYIGRIGIRDEEADGEPLLLDWRAPASRAFYTATSAAPLGVRRRRHIHTRMRTVVGLDDDALDRGVLDELEQVHGGAGSASPLVGEAALLAALTKARTGRMGDVVETIQTEQDAVIRDRLQGILVVQGGPGTGKTAVALHRAAYLLYTHRERLARSGVLIVGPNPTFLRYIGHVLPALGETSAALLTVGELFPGVRARTFDAPHVAEIKGRTEMAAVIDRAVKALRRLPEPDEPLEVVVDGVTYRLDRETCLRAQEKALDTEEPHNVARPVLVDHILEALVDQAAARLTDDPFSGLSAEVLEAIAQDLREHGLAMEGEEIGDGDDALLRVVDRAELRRTLEQEQPVQAALNWLWPELTPQRLINELLSGPFLLDEVAGELAEAEREALRREPGAEWTIADVPLLDEAAELLGAFNAERAARELKRRQEIAYAQGVLDIMAGSRSTDLEDPREEIVSVTDIINAEALADMQAMADLRTVAERAAADRTWTFGHIIVDEAQELSAMAWRVLLRRCPSRSMTLVGDVAQTGDAAGAGSWAQMLEPLVGERWRAVELTVNYRTPSEIMELAAKVLERIDPALRPPQAVRASGVAPVREQVSSEDLPGRLAEVALARQEALEQGKLAVIVPASRAGELTAAVARTLPEASYGALPDLDRRTVVLTARQAKGLEFDSVVLADPEAVAADGPRGENDLYVALTRTTRELTILEVA
ncbi:ATP-binding domain-containing protein [Actinospica durhamensis]|uniref:ATP-binding domain-containing protein n=1 Tax=Actinospica durhamensis TaxID=1508375 RepID=A0A941IUU1_9ACTN|nr:ATP-binding domain-containing protein [Actinospica durhamensis]MBR7836036.1 ATP-binding domain-containing protein [Actinospica durhamensis]